MERQETLTSRMLKSWYAKAQSDLDRQIQEVNVANHIKKDRWKTMTRGTIRQWQVSSWLGISGHWKSQFRVTRGSHSSHHMSSSDAILTLLQEFFLQEFLSLSLPQSPKGWTPGEKNNHRIIEGMDHWSDSILELQIPRVGRVKWRDSSSQE